MAGQAPEKGYCESTSEPQLVLREKLDRLMALTGELENCAEVLTGKLFTGEELDPIGAKPEVFSVNALADAAISNAESAIRKFNTLYNNI